MNIPFDPSHTALLALDCQSGIVQVYAKKQDDYLARASSVLKAARASGMLVVQVKVGFRPGLPEVSEANKLFGAIKSSTPHQDFFQNASGAIHPRLGPEPSDLLITKSRVSAFAGTDLELILRANHVTTIVLFGIATSGVVLSTLLEASDADYRVVVIADCCVDLDPELHTALVERLFPSRAEVIAAQNFASLLQARG